jgi:hypothetical protein
MHPVCIGTCRCYLTGPALYSEELPSAWQFWLPTT